MNDVQHCQQVHKCKYSYDKIPTLHILQLLIEIRITSSAGKDVEQLYPILLVKLYRLSGKHFVSFLNKIKHEFNM